MKIPFLVIIIVALLYWLQWIQIDQYIDMALMYWNRSVELILNFRYKEPIVFMFLPIVAVYLLATK